MEQIKILWVDDEIELLKPHFIFLENRGYYTTGTTNGLDALDFIKKDKFDIVLLDENMPGLNGLETLEEIKTLQPNLPVVMITKNEEEQIMNDAIGAKISDYLIKPVNPNQILLSLKKTLNHKNLIAEKTSQNYQQEFRNITLSMGDIQTHEDWFAFYQKMMYWELELDALEDTSLMGIFESQMQEANHQFARFINKHYQSWMQGEDPPLLSFQLFQKEIFPLLQKNRPTLLLVIDNLRYDQWKVISPEVEQLFKKVSEKPFMSILPTATQYARNAIFSGLTPLEMERRHPQWWKNDIDEGGKNLFEEDFLKAQCERLGMEGNSSFHKIIHLQQGQQLIKNLSNHTHETLTTVVYNFVDMISHAKTEMELIKELAPDNRAYRSLTLSWFKNSPLKELLRKAAELNFQLVLTTDHGTINVGHASGVIGDKDTSLNLRYKTARSLTFEKKHVVHCKTPSDFQLPTLSLNSSFVFATSDYYFVYKNNFNHFANFFRNTFQHGGVSLEEMIIPFVVLEPR